MNTVPEDEEENWELSANDNISSKVDLSVRTRENRCYVYVKDSKYGWIPAELERSSRDSATVIRKPPQRSKAVGTDDNEVVQFPDIDFKVGDENRDLSNDDESVMQKNVEILMDPSLLCRSPSGASLARSSSYSIMSSSLDFESTLGGYNDMVTISLNDYPSGSLPLQCVDDSGILVVYEDMTNMPHLHEAGILYNLKSRYEGPNGLPYTRAGEIVIAINPYRWIKGLYAQKTRLLYAENFVWKANPNALQELPPHLYEASSQAFRGLVFDGKNQSILVSGESGAGKTVSVKVLMSHLTTFHELKKAYKSRRLGENENEIEKNDKIDNHFHNFMQWLSGSFIRKIIPFSRGTTPPPVPVEFDTEEPDETDDEPEEMNQTNLIVQRVLDSNPLLEAFGNAKTPRNDNSSRFSKFVQLQFHVEFLGKAQPSCNIAGSFCHTYLLEKSRVTHYKSPTNERNFHIFYQLLAAPESFKTKIWKNLAGKAPVSFKYIGASRTKKIEGLTDGQRWRRTMAALHTIGIKGERLYSLFRAICVVMQLGNLTFKVDPSNEEGSVIESKIELELLAEIIGVPNQVLSKAFTFKTVNAVHDTYSIPLTVVAAKEMCDSFAKEIYSILFDWLTQAVNDATCATKNYERASKVSEYHTIGLLDIFGFECFETNHFEQLCINHANERLQQKFTKDLFKSVREEYIAEGIGLKNIEYDDNKHVLNLIEGKMGLINLLNEECLRPRGSDAGFVNKLYANHQTNSSSVLKHDKKYNLCKTLFGIRHYAGTVEYDAVNFLIKNGDALGIDVIGVATISKNDLIKSGFKIRKDEKQKRKGSLVTTSVWTKFRNQLSILMNDLNKTKTRYIRCINPNSKKVSGMFDLKYSLDQLRYAGLVSAVTMSRASFPNKMSFTDVLDRFWFLADFNSLKFMKLTSSNRTNSGSNGKNNIWKLISGDFDNRSDLSKTDTLLGHLLKAMEFTSSTGDITKAYVCGNTLVYFKTGALEFLETERLKAYDRCATVIQCMARKNRAKIIYKEISQNPPQKQLTKKSFYSVIMKDEKNVFMLPFFFLKYVWFNHIIRTG